MSGLPQPPVVDPHGSATIIARDVMAGRLRAAHVLAVRMERHAVRGGRLNALVQQRLAAAAAEADTIDAQVAAGELRDAPLAGVPVSVKECFAVRGLSTTLGIKARRGLADADDAPLVKQLRAAGAVVVGKANVPQAMYLHETDNPVWGRTLHPADPSRGPGGSSGGDAALVAVGVVPLAVGNDLAGSLRQPAHACGIAALVPRSVALGTGGAFETMPGLAAVRPRAGFLARCVEDLSLALDAVTAIGQTQPVIRRVAWWDDSGPIPSSPAVRRGVHEAVTRLSEQGIEVNRLPGDLAGEAAWLLLAILAADGGEDIRRLFAGERPMAGVRRLLAIAGVPRRWRPVVAAAAGFVGRRTEAEGVRRTGRRSREEFASLLADREALADRFAAAVSGYDAVICPVSAVPALRHGTAARLVLAAAPCLLANLLELAAGAVPVTAVQPEEERGRRWSLDPVLRAAAATDRGSRGLPIGVQVVGCPGRDEAVVLEVMRMIESGAARG